MHSSPVIPAAAIQRQVSYEQLSAGETQMNHAQLALPQATRAG